MTRSKTEDAFIATQRGPLMITKPVVFPTIKYHKDGLLLTRPGMLILN